MLKILQARLQQYVSRELPDVQAGFRKCRGTRDQIANIRCIIEKAREFQKNIYFCFIDYAKAFDFVDHNKLENSERDGNARPPDLPLQKPVCRTGSTVRTGHVKLNVRKTKIMTFGPITSWQIWLTFIFWAPKSLQMVIATMKLKDAYSLEGKL